MISVVVPAFNEKDAIVGTIDEIRKMLDGAGWTDAEIVIVDDGSTDGTADRAEAAGARVIRHPTNGGYGRALKSGISAASHPIVAITDADGTYPIARIPELKAMLDRGFHMAVGARQGAAYRESAIKHPLRVLLRWLVEFTAGQRIPDPNSGLRVFYRDEIVTFFPQLSNAFSFTTSSTLAYMLTGRFVVYLPIDYAERTGVTKVRLLRDSLRTLQYILQAILFYNPLKLFLVVLAVLAAAGAASIFASIALSCGWLTTLGVGFWLSIVPVGAIGCLAEVVRQGRRN
ncbi:MAG: glycosyltransferase family 2 protein [Alphaproteobacteria bacterium]|nr:glycosyltransferase family 2 protein [Alphaproteobacteria bacterium]